MSEFDIPAKQSTIKKGLIKLGLDYHHAAKHDVAICCSTNNKTMIPRHSKNLNRYTVGSICDFLIANGYTKQQIKAAFGWK
jgi:hypothetical protein